MMAFEWPPIPTELNKVARLILIKAELDNDPESKGYTAMDEQEAAVAMRLQDQNKYDSVGVAELFSELSPDGTWGTIMTIAGDPTHDDYVICIQALGLSREANDFTQQIDMQSAQAVTLLNGLVAAVGLPTFDAARKMAIQDLGVKTTTRAIEAGIVGRVTATDIHHARAL